MTTTWTGPLSQSSETDEGIDVFSQDQSASTSMSQPSSIFCSVLNVCIDQTMENPTALESSPQDESRSQEETSPFGEQHESKDTSQSIQVPVIRVFGSILPGNSYEAPTQSACLYIHGAYPYLLARPVAAGPDGSLIGGALSVLHDDSRQKFVDWDDPEAVRRCIRHFTTSLEESLQNLELHGPANDAPQVESSKTKLKTRFIRRITVVQGRGFYTYCPGPPAPFLRVEYYDPKVRWKVKLQLEKGLDVPEFYHPDPIQYNYQLGGSFGQEDVEEPLKFHCYEAHIPYTMQFFKDYNLSGMSYIHVAKALVRGSLSKSSSISNQFTRAGRPLQFWETKDSSQSEVTGDSDAMNIPKRQTSCDIELDCDAADILNVESVMTSLPSEQEAADEIQWRAVPSLQEIWKQERLRMSKLLPLEQNFLSAVPSSTVTPPFTLNVKKGASRPGARLACQGMWSLINVTPGLSGEFKRSLRQIVERHQRAISRVDEIVAARRQVQESGNDAAAETPLTPTLDEAMAALGALGNQFGDEGVPLAQETPETSQCSLSYPSSQKLREDTITEDPESNVEVYTQRLERGDSILHDSGRDLEDFIDPETLLPYDDLYFGENHCRVIFHVETDAPTTRRVCGANARGCTREGHRSDTFQLDRASPGYYKTVSCGAFVDGTIDVDSTSSDDETDEENDKERFEQTLSILASQVPAQHENVNSWGAIHTGEYTQSSDIPASQFGLTQGLKLGQTFPDDKSDDGSASPSVRSDQELQKEEDDDGERPPTAKEKSLDDAKLGKIGDARTQWDGVCQGILTPSAVPPSRSSISKVDDSTRLHGLEKVDCPSWMSHVSCYESISNETIKARVWFPKIDSDGSYLRPVKGPPDRSRVTAWLKRNEHGSEFGVKRKAERVSTMEIDGNSRKFVPKKKKRIQFDVESNHLLGKQQVEEVAWDNLSQPLTLSASQLTQEQVSPPTLVTTAQSSHTGMKGDIPHDSTSDGQLCEESQPSEEALEGIGAQGGRIHIQGGGGLKAKTRPSQGLTPSKGISDSKSPNFLPCPVSFMVIEIHVQCRTGESRLDSRKMAMVPNSTKDKIFALSYLYGKDPSGGEPLKIEERGCIYVPLQSEEGLSRDEQVMKIRSSMPRHSFGVSAPLTVECVKDEKNLLLRIASVVRTKDPDMLLSWDTQSSGLGYMIERGAAIGGQDKNNDTQQNRSTSGHGGIDMVRLLGRTPHDKKQSHFLFETSALQDFDNATDGQNKDTEGKLQFRGSGLGSDWDDRVGAGAAAASIAGRLVFAAWKIIAEEVKHANASYMPAVTSAVLDKRIPFHDDMVLTKWYSELKGKERWRVLSHRLDQSVACIQLFDALDIIGRAGEAARLSGVELSQSFPGIRGSQYKVEGVLLRALQSLRSDERGSRRGLRVKAKTQGSSETTSSRSPNLSARTKSQSQSPWKLRRTKVESENDSDGFASDDRQYFFYSPSLSDTNRQEALEVQALTLEPLSGHYQDPVVVCDFTALYPSLVIAYNLCYSTCAGKLDYHSTRNEMRQAGKTTGRLGPFRYIEGRTATVLTHHMRSIHEGAKGEASKPETNDDRVYIAPTGTLYASEDVVKGVLPQVLDEILTTRAMLKKAAKEYKKNVPNLSPAILRQLEARQLALKYVANVTYGYTSATFSGRCAMPLLADTIVECGRKTLRKAIDMVNKWGREHPKWKGCKVIYGDTDSLFIKLPGRSYKEAFEFGEYVCKRVTADNPPPVQLKLEKVYVGSIMQTMKRYCGMKFESKNQKRPVFEAKGLETVRRDQCALTQKVLRNALITLFKHGISAVKEYLFRQWALIFAGELPVSDFILTGRVRSKYRGGKEGPVQAVLARRLAEADPGRVVKNKERLPYVIVAISGVTFRLKDCVLTPMELLERWDGYTIHSAYYITKHVNASLQRCLGLAPHNVDVGAWFQECPKPRRRIHFWPVQSKKTTMITSYFGSDICSLCRRKCRAQGRARAVVCRDCQKDRIKAAQIALVQLNSVQHAAQAVAKECAKCNRCFEAGNTFAVVEKGTESKRSASVFSRIERVDDSLRLPIANCTCIDCPITYERHRLREKEVEALAVCEALNLDDDR